MQKTHQSASDRKKDEKAYGDFHDFRMLRDLIREKSQSALSQMVDASNVSIHEVSIHDDFMYGTKMAFIVIHSDQIQMTLKAHYFHQTKLAGVPDLTISEADRKDPLADWMREFCNQTSGLILENLCLNNIQAHMTIPFSTEGFDEAFFSDKVWPSEHRDWWNLQWTGGSIICSSSCKISDSVKVGKIDKNLAKANDGLILL